ncbi:MAG: Gfo/Idh/MocA family oxidoreductase [Alistipes sp.]|nr:Gfo/Idh/MocA family oxidoreductase [Alistipes sp.]
MEKIRFVIVGSGWRSLYYVRIAKALPRQFELCAMLCRTEDKAERIAAEHGIYTTMSKEECRGLKPDFVVVAVNKASIAEVSKEWLGYGFTVLCETPAALDLATLKELWELHQKGAKLSVAEQYTRYPVYEAMLKVLDGNIIGEPYSVNVSLAHEYHGASLIRAFLREEMTPFRITGKTYTFPTAQTLSRYERFTDGKPVDKSRTLAVVEFKDGKTAFYDFDSEQYRSPIRKNYVDVRGSRGQMKEETFYYLDKDNMPREVSLEISRHNVITQYENPNLREVTEIDKIAFDGAVVYEPRFGSCGLASDETAVAAILLDTALYAAGEKEPEYPLRYALQDAYTAILLQEAVLTGKTAVSGAMPWHEDGK